MSSPDLSIVIPNYNEKANLERGVLEEMATYLNQVKFSYEVIINDDGSTDGGLQSIDSFVKSHPHFSVIKNSHVGKAGGIWAGIQKAKGKVTLFTDMDQSTPLKEVEKLLPWYDQGFDVVFGSRGALRKNFPLSRQIMSWGFRTFRQIFLLRGVVDTQCGFKSLRTSVAKEIFPLLEVIASPKQAKGWSVSAFDVELLFLAEKRGYRLKEVDVTWKDEDISTSKPRNFIHESTGMLKQILRVKLNDISGKYSTA